MKQKSVTTRTKQKVKKMGDVMDEWNNVRTTQPLWLMSKDFTEEGTSYVINDVTKQKTLSGLEVPTLLVEGHYKDYHGKFFVSKWSLIFSKDWLDYAGTDVKKWVGLKCTFKKVGTTQAARLHVYPFFDTEENLQRSTSTTSSMSSKSCAE